MGFGGRAPKNLKISVRKSKFSNKEIFDLS